MGNLELGSGGSVGYIVTSLDKGVLVGFCALVMKVCFIMSGYFLTE